jgi:protocatechuate 3,4-dioxygenase beta subunit
MRPTDPQPPFDISFRATTDADGNYRIVNIPPGSYQISPRAGAYVVLDTDNRTGRNLVLSEGDAVDGIDFSLVRGGVITGKITDAEGRPVIEQRVNVMVGETLPNQRGPYYGIMGVETDDRGVYRIFGLKPGKYSFRQGRESRVVMTD